MAKKGGGSKSYQKKKDATTTSRRDRYNFSAEDMDDEIDICNYPFHLLSKNLIISYYSSSNFVILRC